MAPPPLQTPFDPAARFRYNTPITLVPYLEPF